MKDELLRYNNKQKYLIFDFETSNLNLVSPSNRPWQLSFIIATKDKILEKQKFGDVIFYKVQRVYNAWYTLDDLKNEMNLIE